jgi:hypothetical protein
MIIVLIMEINTFLMVPSNTSQGAGLSEEELKMNLMNVC